MKWRGGISQAEVLVLLPSLAGASQSPKPTGEFGAVIVTSATSNILRGTPQVQVKVMGKAGPLEAGVSINHAKECVSKTGSFTLGVAASLKLEGSSFGKAEEECVTEVPLSAERKRESEKSCATSSKPFQHFFVLLMFIFF